MPTVTSQFPSRQVNHFFLCSMNLMPCSIHRKNWDFIKSILFASNAVKTQALWTLQDINPSWKMTPLKKKKGHFAISCLWGQPESLHLISFLTWMLVWAQSFVHSLVRNKEPAGEGKAGKPNDTQLHLFKVHGCTRCFGGLTLVAEQLLFLVVCDKGKACVTFSTDTGLQIGYVGKKYCRFSF